MSQTADTATAAPVLSPARTLETALSFFEKTVWNNPDVCSNCMAQVRHRYQATVEDRSGKVHDVDEGWLADDGTLGEDEHYVRRRGEVTVRNDEGAVVGVTSREPARGTTRNNSRTTCENCGSVGAIKQKDTLSKGEALDAAETLAERLREQGYAVSTTAARSAVKRLKSDEDHSGNDKEILAVAAALGVEKA